MQFSAFFFFFFFKPLTPKIVYSPNITGCGLQALRQELKAFHNGICMFRLPNCKPDIIPQIFAVVVPDHHPHLPKILLCIRQTEKYKSS